MTPDRALRLLSSLAATVAMAACAGFAPESPRFQPKEGLLRTTLDNGLEVLLIEDHSAPVTALNVWVRTGSADETPGEAGMAHVFEHMLFKGTERRAVGEIAATVESAGGMVNAFTSHDMTVYHITMASRDTAVGIDVLADAVQHSTFDANELAREIEVVVEEIRRSEDSPGSVLSQALFATAYRNHPYGRPVIGSRESVRSFRRDDLLAFHRKWYVPNNMAFIVVGDIDAERVLAQIREAFAGAKPSKALAHPRPVEPPVREPRATVVRSTFEQSLLGLTWPITSFRDEDTPYLDLLSLVLGGGESSRLYREVQDRQRLVHSISAGSYTPLDAGQFMIDAALDAARIEDATRAIAEEVRLLREAGPSQSELERARTNILASQVHEKETMQGQARKVGYFHALGGGLEYEQVYLDRIRHATPDDLRRVAREYLAPEGMSAVALLAKGERADLDETRLLAAFRSGANPARAQVRGEEIAPGLFRYRLGNGLRVIVKPVHSVPLVSMRISFLGGLLAESEADQGLTSFLAEMLDRGTERRSAGQLAKEVEDIAGSLEGFSGRNSFGISGEFLAESLEEGLDLFADVLLHPAFDASEIEKLREDRIAALRRREDNLSSRAFDLLFEAMYPGHPYRFPTIGTPKSVTAFDRAALVSYWERYARPHDAVLAVVGDVDPDRFVERLSEKLGDWGARGDAELPARTRPPAPSRAREAVLEKNKNQVHVVVGFPGLDIRDPDAPALQVLSQILAGQGGRLFLELRDRQSLAYSVTAFSIEGIDPGVFAVYIASAPEKLEDARNGLISELRKVVEQPVSAEELTRARNFLIGSHAVALQRFGTQASQLSLDELYGLGATHHLGYAERIDAVKLEDLVRVARRLIHIDRPTIAIVR